MARSDILLIFWGSRMFACRLLDDLCQQYDNRAGCWSGCCASRTGGREL